MTFDPTGSWEQDARREEFYREKYGREREIAALKAEIERLKAGRFTEEEFQNLCHNFTCEDRKRFEEGCKAYQDKLFGADPDPFAVPKEISQRVNNLRERLEREETK